MHEYLRSIGFSSTESKTDLRNLINWACSEPDRMSVVPLAEDENVCVVERDISGHAGIAVVGEINEIGNVVPEYYFPYIISTHISSEANLTYEKQTAKTGYIGMCEDYRMGMALIFSVKNLADVARLEQENEMPEAFKGVSLSLLASDGMVLLPMAENVRVPQRVSNGSTFLSEPDAADTERTLEQDAKDALLQMEKYRNALERIQETDVFSVVDNFFMPHGLESDKYYFLGRILARQRIQNELTKEYFYRLLIDSNGMEFIAAINEKDLIGTPEAGMRIKCHGWLLGELVR